MGRWPEMEGDMAAVLIVAIAIAVASVLFQVRKCTRKFRFTPGTLPDGVMPSETQLRYGLFDNM